MFGIIKFFSVIFAGIELFFVSANSDITNAEEKNQSKSANELEVGDKAPDFLARTYGGKIVKLKDYLDSKNILLYFYPKDDTPGCTKEACSFRDNLKQLSSTNTTVLGVSVDNVISHEKFKEKYKLNFDLISDNKHAIVKKYGVIRERNNRVSANRVTFLIDKKGIIKYIWKPVKVTGHTEEVLEKIKELELD